MTKSTITIEPITHDLKIYPEFFSAVCTGVKRAELRKNDRDYRVGDTLRLMETPRGSCHQTGEVINVKITHIADVGEWMPGYVLLSVELQERRNANSEPVENHIGSKNALDAIVSFIKSKNNPTVKCYEEVSEQLFKDNCHGIHSHVIEYILKLGEELEDLQPDEIIVTPPAYPETLPCPVLLEPGLRFGKGVATSTMLKALQRRADYNSDLDVMTPEQRAEHDANIEAFKAMLPQPAPVVPDESYQQLSELYHAQEKRLFKIAQRIKGPAFDKYSHSPSQAIDVLEVAIFGDDEACRAAMLHAGNSPANPDCWCRTCRPVDLNDMRFVVCPDCGNKRCPRANDHRNACTGSNEPGQEGIAYPDTPQSPGSEPATVPGKWIPVSERMPDREVDVQVYCPDKKEQMVAYLERNELDGYFRFATWRTGDGIYCQPTHWMPLPAAPQEAINALIPLASRNEQEGK